MKLTDFLDFAPLNELREKMGVNHVITWQPEVYWQRLNANEWREIHRGGLDVNIEEIHPQSDGTLEYRGRKVVVYIRDQNSYHTYSLQNHLDSEYKFHLAWCETLIEMKKKRRYNTRYVVSRRKDGRFMVNRILSNQVVDKNLELEMKVCKYCLRRIDYKGYRNNRERVYRGFSIKEYFEKYDSYINALPPHTENTAPLNTYPSNFSELSQKLREAKGWICEECGRDFSKRKNFLHTHHENGDKSDNNPKNLRVLCLYCHSKQPGHEHMRAS